MLPFLLESSVDSTCHLYTHMCNQIYNYVSCELWAEHRTASISEGTIKASWKEKAFYRVAFKKYYFKYDWMNR